MRHSLICFRSSGILALIALSIGIAHASQVKTYSVKGIYADVAAAAPAPGAASAQDLVNAAIQLEIAGDRTGAAAAYKKVVDFCAADASQTKEIKQLGEEAARSVQLLQMPLEPSTDPAKPSCHFLGLDKTIGSNWQNAVGSEAWILFALHNDKDYAGGPKVLDGTFTYRAINGEPAGEVRRWRSPADFKGNPKADIPLYDPVSSTGDTVTSFLGDNGQDYPAGAGPDIRLELSVPAGEHVLSIPIHFSDPDRAQAHYSFTVLSKDDETEHYLASTIVGVSDAPGYLRASISGATKYVLIVRRLDSLDVNIPAIFLDAFRRTRAFSLSDEFSVDELAEAKIDPIAVGNENDHSVRGRLQYLASSYLQKNVDDAVLGAQARNLVASPDLNEAQHAVAAFMSWRFFEDAPLAAGRRVPAFALFAVPRYGLISERAYSDVPGLMIERADKLRAASRCAYAEAVDDALWDMGLRRGIADITDKGTALSVQMAMVQLLWKRGPEKYLATNKVLVTSGADDKAPDSVLLSLDPIYAARKARLGCQVLISGNLNLGMTTTSISTPVTAGPDDSANAAREWLDELATSLGASPAGLKSASTQKPPAPKTQPADGIVFAAAAAPFLGSSLSVPETPASPSEIAQAGPLAAKDPAMPATAEKDSYRKSCLLKDTEMETLIQSYANRDLYPTPEQLAINSDLGIRVITLLKEMYPDYPRMDSVDETLKNLQQNIKHD